MDPHAGARRRQQHLCLWRHGGEFPHRHRARRRARRGARPAIASARLRRWPRRCWLLPRRPRWPIYCSRGCCRARRPAAERAQLGFIDLPLNALFAGLLLLPMTVAIGMTYPLAVRVLARDADGCGASQRPRLRLEHGRRHRRIAGGRIRADPAAAIRRRDSRRRADQRRAGRRSRSGCWRRSTASCAVVASVLAVVGCALFAPQAPMKLLVTSPLNLSTQGRVLYYDIGRSASVVMLSQDGGLALRTNGLPEALMDGPGSVPRFSGEFWLSPLAVIARPQARDMLIVGLRRWRGDRGRAVQRASHRRHRARAQGHRGQSPDRSAAPARSAERSARQRDPQRRARRAAPHESPLRRHRLAALTSLDRGRLAPVHARVHAARTRSPHRRTVCSCSG